MTTRTLCTYNDVIIQELFVYTYKEINTSILNSYYHIHIYV